MTRKVKEFESGKKYLKMRQEFESVFDRQNMTIKKPEKELAAAHSETVTVRKIWFGAMDDMEAECKKEIHSLQREYLRAVKKTTEAERQRDEALDKLRDKNRELYETKNALYEAEQKTAGLTKYPAGNWICHPGLSVIFPVSFQKKQKKNGMIFS